MYVYHILANAESVRPIEIVSEANLHERVAELSGRAHILGLPSVARRLRERGGVYVAANRESEWRAKHGSTRGFIVRKVRVTYPEVHPLMPAQDARLLTTWRENAGRNT